MTDGPTDCGRCLAEDTDPDLQCDSPTDPHLAEGDLVPTVAIDAAHGTQPALSRPWSHSTQLFAHWSVL